MGRLGWALADEAAQVNIVTNKETEIANSVNTTSVFRPMLRAARERTGQGWAEEGLRFRMHV
ncbi:hypothetical protein GmRootA79_25130 [Acidovorax sp. A79]